MVLLFFFIPHFFEELEQITRHLLDENPADSFSQRKELRKTVVEVGSGQKYKVAFLLYFGQPDSVKKTSNLFFSFRGKTTEIEVKPNRGVLFVPSPETKHWIPEVPQDSALRLAFSGWLL